MNLVLSGPIDPNLLQLAVALAGPREVVRLHERAQRLVGADDSEATRQEIDRICEIARVDHAFVPEGLRFSDFKLLAMDMDSTLITIECIDEIADFAGKKKEVAAITEAAMRGEIPDFAESLRRRVALLAGTNAEILKEVFESRLSLSPGVTTLLEAAKVASMTTLLLSGGFTYFAKRLSETLKLDEFHANELEIQDGKITGKVVGRIIGGSEKAQAVNECAIRIGAQKKEIIVVGDGANDIEMMKLASTSVAYRAKPSVAKIATHKIQFGGLGLIVDWLDNPKDKAGTIIATD